MKCFGSPSSPFHSLHATWHALQPVQMEVSTNIPLLILHRASSLSSLYVAGEHLAFVDRYVRVGHHGAEIIHNIPLGAPLPSPVPRQADFMDDPAVDVKRLHAPRHQRPGLNFAARRFDGDIIGVLYP